MQSKCALFWFLLQQRYGAQSLRAVGASRAASWWGRLHIFPAPYMHIYIIHIYIYTNICTSTYIPRSIRIPRHHHHSNHHFLMVFSAQIHLGRLPKIFIRAWHYCLLIWRETLRGWVYCPKHASVPSLRCVEIQKRKMCSLTGPLLNNFYHQKLAK